jgi:hypothetical protein
MVRDHRPEEDLAVRHRQEEEGTVRHRLAVEGMVRRRRRQEDEALVAACTLHFCGTATSERWGWLSAYLMQDGLTSRKGRRYHRRLT